MPPASSDRDFESVLASADLSAANSDGGFGSLLAAAAAWSSPEAKNRMAMVPKITTSRREKQDFISFTVAPFLDSEMIKRSRSGCPWRFCGRDGETYAS
jgi:hypothetical protein